MLSVEQIQTCLNTIKAENRTLARLVERRKQRLPENEHKSERPAFRVPELEKVLAGVDVEVDALMAIYNL